MGTTRGWEHSRQRRRHRRQQAQLHLQDRPFQQRASRHVPCWPASCALHDHEGVTLMDGACKLVTPHSYNIILEGQGKAHGQLDYREYLRVTAMVMITTRKSTPHVDCSSDSRRE